MANRNAPSTPQGVKIKHLLRQRRGGCAQAHPPCYPWSVQVVLRKIGRGGRTITGRLVRAPRKGSVIVIEFSDGMHEYVTTPVRRVLKLAGGEVFYIETMNSRYRLEVRTREMALDDVMGGSNS
jgi:hypothetical protein